MATDSASFSRVLADRVAAVRGELVAARSPLTLWCSFAVAVVVVVQVGVALRAGTSVRTLTTALFYVEPWLAWPLAFFLHRGPFHALVNVALIVYLGRLAERNFSPGGYAAFLLAGAVGSIAGGYLFITTFGDGPVAAYGASGLGFALAAYSLQYARRDAPTTAEWVAVIVGVAAVATVTADVLTGPVFHPAWMNGAHLTGLLVGVVAGTRHARRRDSGI